MFVAIARITLSIPDSGSLKSKRHVVRKVLDKVKARFNVSVAEVEDNDLWQKATLGVAAVANDHAFAQESVDKVVRFVEELYVAPVIGCSTEVIPLGSELYGEDDGTSFGSAARGAHRTLADAEAQTPRDLRTLAEAEGRARPSARGPARPNPKRPLSEDQREQAIEELRRRMREAAAERDEGEDEA